MLNVVAAGWKSHPIKFVDSISLILQSVVCTCIEILLGHVTVPNVNIRYACNVETECLLVKLYPGSALLVLLVLIENCVLDWNSIRLDS